MVAVYVARVVEGERRHDPGSPEHQSRNLHLRSCRDNPGDLCDDYCGMNMIDQFRL